MSSIKTFIKEETPGRVIEYLMQLLFESPPERFPTEDEVLDWMEIINDREDSLELIQASLLCEAFIVPLEYEDDAFYNEDEEDPQLKFIYE